MGSEYWGLPDELLAQLDQRVTIPMTDGIDSFSVNAAAAIVLYELQRQR
jgi:tRNA G18 (ribose-2'-O)-methylase SpoU